MRTPIDHTINKRRTFFFVPHIPGLFVATIKNLPYSRIQEVDSHQIRDNQTQMNRDGQRESPPILNCRRKQDLSIIYLHYLISNHSFCFFSLGDISKIESSISGLISTFSHKIFTVVFPSTRLSMEKGTNNQSTFL